MTGPSPAPSSAPRTVAPATSASVCDPPTQGGPDAAAPPGAEAGADADAVSEVEVDADADADADANADADADADADDDDDAALDAVPDADLAAEAPVAPDAGAAFAAATGPAAPAGAAAPPPGFSAVSPTGCASDAMRKARSSRSCALAGRATVTSRTAPSAPTTRSRQRPPWSATSTRGAPALSAAYSPARPRASAQSSRASPGGRRTGTAAEATADQAARSSAHIRRSVADPVPERRGAGYLGPVNGRVLLPLLLLGACAGGKAEDRCGRLADAIAACGVAHGVPASVYAADACAGWDESLDRVLGPSYECRAEVWEGADCATDAGWAAALQADACCAPPGSTAQPGEACAAP